MEFQPFNTAECHSSDPQGAAYRMHIAMLSQNTRASGPVSLRQKTQVSRPTGQTKDVTSDDQKHELMLIDTSETQLSIAAG